MTEKTWEYIDISIGIKLGRWGTQWVHKYQKGSETLCGVARFFQLIQWCNLKSDFHFRLSAAGPVRRQKSPVRSSSFVSIYFILGLFTCFLFSSCCLCCVSLFWNIRRASESVIDFFYVCQLWKIHKAPKFLRQVAVKKQQQSSRNQSISKTVSRTHNRIRIDLEYFNTRSWQVQGHHRPLSLGRRWRKGQR